MWHRFLGRALVGTLALGLLVLAALNAVDAALSAAFWELEANPAARSVGPASFLAIKVALSLWLACGAALLVLLVGGRGWILQNPAVAAALRAARAATYVAVAAYVYAVAHNVAVLALRL